MRPMPQHLQIERYNAPGPGTYKLADTVRTLRREETSLQTCTWSRRTKHNEFIDIPKNNPGPGDYRPELGEKYYQENRCQPMSAGYRFGQQEPRNFMHKQLEKNRNPGAGQYESQSAFTNLR